jgi:hypothetical protein
MGGITEIGDRLIASVKQYVGDAVAGIGKRLDEFDARIKSIPHGPAGKDGRDGKDADPELVRTVVSETFPGMVERVQAGLEQRIDKAVSLIPVPKDGTPGRDGVDGKNGADADPALIEIAVQKAVSLIPVPKDGKDGIPGIDGAPGRDGASGRDGEKGEPGKDGKDVEASAIDDAFDGMAEMFVRHLQ